MKKLKSMIQTDNQTDTRILRFTVLDANAKEAKKIANELADVTAERVAYVMSSDKPKVVEEAVVPKYPSSPNTRRILQWVDLHLRLWQLLLLYFVIS